MPYSYIEHVSDIGIRATGATLEEAFESGAQATLDVMFELDSIEEALSVPITAEAPRIDLLFVEVINEVLSVQSRQELALKRLNALEISPVDGSFVFRGSAFGERLDLKKHRVRTEVKGATYSGLTYSVIDGVHTLACILDV